MRGAAGQTMGSGRRTTRPLAIKTPVCRACRAPQRVANLTGKEQTTVSFNEQYGQNYQQGQQKQQKQRQNQQQKRQKQQNPGQNQQNQNPYEF